MLPVTLALYDDNDNQTIASPQNLRFTKHFQGGIDVEMSFFLPRSLDFDYAEIGQGQKAELWYGLTRVFLGVQREIAHARQGNSEGFNIRCVGYKAYLEDFCYGGKGKLWCDTRYSEWRVVRKEDNNAYRPKGLKMDRNDRIYIEWPDHANRAADRWGGYAYICPYDNVERVTFDWEIFCLEDERFVARLRSYDSDFDNVNWLWGHKTPGSGSKDITLSTPRPVIIFAIKDWGDPGYWDEGHYLKVTNLKVFGTTDTSPTASDIATDIASELSSDTPISANTDLIETVSLELIPLAFEVGESCYDALKSVCSHGDANHKLLSWGIESGADRIFISKPDYTAVRYIIPPHQATKIEARSAIADDYLSEGWGQYEDERGDTQYTDKYYAHVTPTGIEANTTSTGDDLASTVYGVKRSDIVELGPLDEDVAIEAIKLYLTEKARPLITASVQTQAPVIDLSRGGERLMPIELEVGHLCQIPWLRATHVEGASGSDLREWETTFLLAGLEYSHDRRTARLILEQDVESAARLLAYIKKFGTEEE